ncbi:MAG: hypothetical protein IJW50_01245 [Clostridia bacterium]|nr:hypothetical protein [Clostridia bacterium]
MKKLIAVLLSLICILSFAGCSHQDASEYVVKDGDNPYLILPESEERVYFWPNNGLEPYLEHIDLNMLKKAERVLKEKAEPYEKNDPSYQLDVEDGRLYLVLLAYLEPHMGCGNRPFDVFQEPISRVVRN